jgi:DNA topoisomerase-1
MKMPEETAFAAGALVYSAEIENPITRHLEDQGFAYFDSAGRRITDPAILARIGMLAIPPAYTDVEITSNPDAHLQATGRDARGRKQYRYHPHWSAGRGEAKFAQLSDFGRALPAIRAVVHADLARKRPDYRKALATVVWLLDNLHIRIGNETYAQTNGSYGLTTLRNRHIRLEGSAVRFRFKGKSGKAWDLSHRDRRIARAIRRLQELPGQLLFQYLDGEGGCHPLRSQDVNAYIREATGAAFSSRQFRTWAATHMAAVSLSQVEPATSDAAIKRQINAAVDAVAQELYNTRAVCRTSYIHPKVFEGFRDGTLQALPCLRLGRSKAAEWMDDSERRVLKWLES